jgi:hypothetical protein
LLDSTLVQYFPLPPIRQDTTEVQYRLRLQVLMQDKNPASPLGHAAWVAPGKELGHDINRLTRPASAETS